MGGSLDYNVQDHFLENKALLGATDILVSGVNWFLPLQTEILSRPVTCNWREFASQWTFGNVWRHLGFS